MKNLYRNLLLSLTFGIALNASASVVTLSDITNNTSLEICDECTVTSTIDVNFHGRITDINILIGELLHPYDADLKLTISHGNKSVVLANRLIGSGDQDFINTLFDDSAATSILSGIAYAPFSGSFSPEELLSAFNDMDIFGTWSLTVADMEAGDSGVLNSWSLRATSVPEPTSVLLFALGLLALAARKARVQRG